MAFSGWLHVMVLTAERIKELQMAVNVAINEASLFDVLVRQGHQRGIFGVTNAE